MRACWFVLAVLVACGPAPEAQAPAPEPETPVVEAEPEPTPGPETEPEPVAAPSDPLPSLDALPEAMARRSTRRDSAHPVPHDVELNAAAEVALFEVALEPEETHRVAERAELEVHGVVIAGTVTLTDAAVGARGDGNDLEPWQAFRALGGSVDLKASGGGPARVLVVVASHVPGQAIARPAEGPPAKGRRIPRRGRRTTPIEVVDLQAREALRWGEGRFEARLAWDHPWGASLGVLAFDEEASVAEHTHPGETECLFILRGAGVLPVGRERRKVEPGSTLCIPKGQMHAFEASGTSPLLAVQVYVPPGPEQRFVDLAHEERDEAP